MSSHDGFRNTYSEEIKCTRCDKILAYSSDQQDNIIVKCECEDG